MTARALILMYHSIAEPSAAAEARLCVRPREFARQMRWLRSHCAPVDLDRVVDGLAGGDPLPANAVAVTFDDGFADVREHALPALRDHAIPATLYAVAGLSGRTAEWLAPHGIAPRRLMSEEELRALDRAGIAIGSHTLTHPQLPGLSRPKLTREVADSRCALEQAIGRPVRHFAYPYGAYDEPAKEAVREAGYASAVTTRSGFNAPGADLLELRRIDVLGTDSLSQFRRKVEFGATTVGTGLLLRYYAGRVLDRLRPP